MTTPRIKINRNSHAYEQDLTSNKRSNWRVFADIALFLPLSLLISCTLIIFAVLGVPSTVKNLKGFASTFLPFAESVHEVLQDYNFKDVRSDSPYFESISYLKGKGVIDGYDDGTYRPQNEITRAELVKLLVNSKHQFPLDMNYNNCFSDVSHQWFASAACFAKQNGWVGGFADGSFGPGQALNRAEALKIVMEAYDIDVENTRSQPQFSDVSEKDWFYPYVQAAVGLKLIDQDPIHDLFEPHESITRGEAFNMLYHVMNY